MITITRAISNEFIYAIFTSICASIVTILITGLFTCMFDVHHFLFHQLTRGLVPSTSTAWSSSPPIRSLSPTCWYIFSIVIKLFSFLNMTEDEKEKEFEKKDK